MSTCHSSEYVPLQNVWVVAVYLRSVPRARPWRTAVSCARRRETARWGEYQVSRRRLWTSPPPPGGPRNITYLLLYRRVSMTPVRVHRRMLVTVDVRSLKYRCCGLTRGPVTWGLSAVCVCCCRKNLAAVENSKKTRSCPRECLIV